MPLRHIIDLGWWIYRMINFTAKKASPSCFMTAWNYKPYNMDTYPAFLWFKIRSMDWWYKDEHAGLKVTELMSVGWVSHLLFVHSVVLFFGFPLFFLSHWERRSAWGLEEAPTSATCPPHLYQPTWPESHFHLQESGIKKDINISPHTSHGLHWSHWVHSTLMTNQTLIVLQRAGWVTLLSWQHV